MKTKTFPQHFALFDESIRTRCSALLYPEAANFAKGFYDELSQDAEASEYLDNELVHQRLFASFENWIQQLFPVDSEPDGDQLDELHRIVGIVHVRIGIPMHLISRGMQTVRDHATPIILGGFEGEDQVEAILFVNRTLDTCLSLMNDVYLDRALSEQQASQKLRATLPPAELALECERIRSELFIWLKNLVFWKDLSGRDPSIMNSPFGLWITHKAELYFPDSEEIQKIRGLISRVDVLATQVSGKRQNSLIAFSTAFERLSGYVDRISYFLSQLATSTMAESKNKDSLTKLISRELMSGIMRKEISVSRERKIAFGILMIDIDNFKQINDNYGHQFGDMVLEQVAETILGCVRATDFCFRYGGEEILVVLPNTTHEVVCDRAETIRHSIADKEYAGPNKSILVTVSVGVGMYEGHPDYERVIETADKKLYEAKNSGKNRVCC